MKSEVQADDEMRQRVLGAAFKAFTENGYARTSTLDIATRAKVSKRDLYALYASKQAMLIACIRARSSRTLLPAEYRAPENRDALAASLKAFGIILLTEVSSPQVIAMFRLAIGESQAAPEVARALDERRHTNRGVVRDIVAHAQSLKLLPAGDAQALAGEFIALLWQDLQLGLLLGVIERPSRVEIERRAATATDILLRLYPM
jgi:AcrR family transcriptional regulator